MVVEDSPHDFYAVKRGLKAVDLAENLIHCETGEQALDTLTADFQSANPAAVLPRLILLDLNLPGLSGAQVLQRIRDDTRLKTLPVVILTTSDDPKDIAECYALGASSYISKPLTLAAATALKEYWFGQVTLPEFNAAAVPPKPGTPAVAEPAPQTYNSGQGLK